MIELEQRVGVGLGEGEEGDGKGEVSDTVLLLLMHSGNYTRRVGVDPMTIKSTIDNMHPSTNFWFLHKVSQQL